MDIHIPHINNIIALICAKNGLFMVDYKMCFNTYIYVYIYNKSRSDAMKYIHNNNNNGDSSPLLTYV